jgi:hypothetical protein
MIPPSIPADFHARLYNSRLYDRPPRDTSAILYCIAKHAGWPMYHRAMQMTYLLQPEHVFPRDRISLSRTLANARVHDFKQNIINNTSEHYRPHTLQKTPEPIFRFIRE